MARPSSSGVLLLITVMQLDINYPKPCRGSCVEDSLGGTDLSVGSEVLCNVAL